MNREIKFRGKRKDGKGWAYGCLIKYWKPDGDAYVGIMGWKGDHFEVHPETVGQYTGVKDKDGKEIYEDDVVNQEKWVSVGNYTQATGIVKYKSIRFTCECIGDWLGSNADLNENAIVIGNIHDNIELLKTETK